MTKVLFLLSAVVMAVACFFSWQNRQSFIEARKARQELDRAVNTEFTKASNAANEVVTVKANVTAVSGEVEAEKTRKEQAEIKLRNVNKDADLAANDLTTTTGEINKIKATVKKLPEGVTLETVGENIAKLKATIAENQHKEDQVKESVAAKEKEVKKLTDDLGKIQKEIEDRRRLYDRNSLTATVVAVNNDWGFVVIDGGVNKGITTDTKLLATRGSETIGKLNIVAVEGNKTIANIVQKSVRGGLSVAPGDRVILETLYQ